MNIFEKIKQILFNKKQVKALPEQTQNVKNYTSTMVLTRNDGTIVTIKPELDKLGNPRYEQIWSRNEGKMKCIPKFIVYSDELKEIYGNAILGKSILLDINSSDLQNPEFAEYIANNVLNKERMPKIMNQYCGYAGIVKPTLDDMGNTCFEKIIDPSIIDNLKLSKENREQMMQQEIARREQERISMMEEKAKNMQVHYKDSHAEDLSKYQR